MRALADTQSFRDLIESGSVYVDTTEQIFSLLQNRRTFIARPYGFGKSLMLDTIGTLLGLGVEPYFRNTWIYGRWTEKSYPVLRLDFQKFSCSDHQKFCEDFDRCLAEFAGRNNFPYVPAERPLRSMKSLLRSLRSGNIRVAVLIDDYDAPLAANVSNPEMYERFRISMRELQGVMKGAPAISFLCIAAITRVKDPSEFPGGSDIRDMSYYGPVSAIAGFTREELIKYYGDFVARAVSLLKGIPEDQISEDQTEDFLDRLSEEYGGYSFDDEYETRVFSPLAVNRFLKYAALGNEIKFGGSLFGKGLVPPALSGYLETLGISPDSYAEDFYADSDDFLFPPSLPGMKPEVLLCQTGLLTARSPVPDGGTVRLWIPNNMARRALTDLAL